MKKENGIARSAVLVTLMMLCFKILGFVKQAVIAAFYGATNHTDIYFIAYGVVSGIAEAAIKATGVSIVAVYSGLIVKKGIKEGSKLINALLEIVVPIFTIVSLLIIVLSPVISKAIAPTYSETAAETLSRYIKYIAPILMFAGIELVLSSVLDSNKSFFVPRLQSLIYSLSVIVGCFFFSYAFGINVLIFAEYFSLVLYSVILIFAVRRFHKFAFVKIKQIPELKIIVVTAIPLFIGNSVLQINQIVDKSISSGLEAGATSSLTYCHTLEQFVTNIMIVNIGNVLFANFAGMAAEGEENRIKDVLSKAINYLIIIMLYISVITIYNSERIVKLVYFRGNFTENALRLTATALVGYAFSFVAVAVRDLSIKSLYAFKDTKRPMYASIICIAINICLSIVLSASLGIFGIAIATSISAFIGMFINAYSLKKYMASYSYFQNLVVFLRSIPSAAGVMVFCKAFNKLTDINHFASLLITSTVGLFIYCGIFCLFNKQEARKIYFLIKQKINNRS